ncbi:hypothetical protein [Allorhizocola rhizosphaerae]|uniref:hypothetical protein n=1 Tax=Allorhizocola rhizosphaerae TaxID=1872709 RepID=UPI000E3CEBB8|nr:hypothetical protein [Allorhizocola rhizosphaerae]
MTTERDNTGFWTVAIGAPVLLSVLRLWIEAGGELQTTLLLVEHVDPINLVAALVATGSWLVSAMFVAALAIGGMLGASGETAARAWLARWAEQAPSWVKLGSFVIAAFTWQLIYLPLLLLALCAAYQLTPRRVWVALVCLALYGVVIGQTLVEAFRLPDPSTRAMAVLLLAGPAVLAVFIAGPLRPRAVRPFAIGAPLLGVAMLLWAALPLVTTPVLPLTVTVIGGPEDSVEYVRGHVITTDDVHMVVLEESGQVRYIDNDLIEAQDLCPTSQEIPRYRLRFLFPGVEPVSLEHSVLSGLGQANRGSTPGSPACRSRTR